MEIERSSPIWDPVFCIVFIYIANAPKEWKGAHLLFTFVKRFLRMSMILLRGILASWDSTLIYALESKMRVQEVRNDWDCSRLTMARKTPQFGVLLPVD